MAELLSMEINSHNLALFSIFHHDISFESLNVNYDTQHLYKLGRSNVKSASYKDIADSLYAIITSNINGYRDDEISLTLTGGFDSRIILACLLKSGIKPNCYTYGNCLCKDSILASRIAKEFGLRYQNLDHIQDKSWYYNWVIETIKRGKGEIYLHRAHRTYAISQHCKEFHPRILFTGHMGGEGIKKFQYNNYYTSALFEEVNEKRISLKGAVDKILRNYFINIDLVNTDELVNEIGALEWMKHDSETNKFFLLYDLAGKIHHYQDIRIYETFVPEVIPVYLQKEYLEVLFSSKYNILNERSSVRDPDLYCKMLEYLFPELLNYPLSNNYNPSDYLKGMGYYLPVRFLNKYFRSKKYPSSFPYGSWYKEFLYEHAENIDDKIWDYYDKQYYFTALNNDYHETTEGYWHKFSNPLFFDLLTKSSKGDL